MLESDSQNVIFQLATNLVNHTSQHIFLTGKAGTGKTTFLKYIRENTQKQSVIVAPTGVAAINAGGVTMHSFFQLPFGPFVPATAKGFNTGSTAVADKHSLFSNIRFNTNKRDLLNELELLIIDEISMVRADMLDAMDTILRHFRKKPALPFGGVQVLYIGDLFQLPPVMPEAEWEILSDYYQSPFFFHSKVISEAPPLYVELKKIYRQNETRFINLLNSVRNNRISASELDVLNKQYNPSFEPTPKEKYITLCTHNRNADVINNAQLAKLTSRLHRFKGTITKDFSDKALPTDMELLLKEGAQIMFIKNDSGTERRYYNGKIGTIKKLSEKEITVSFDNAESDFKLEKEKWKNLRYTHNKERDKIEEEEIGSFEQYPIRLAWAITIHKSQGLTFSKAIIDAGASFAAGQVYVALSRCTSLDGIVLYSKINRSAITTDNRVIEFSNKEIHENHLQEILDKERKNHETNYLIKAFDWSKIATTYLELKELTPSQKLPNQAEAVVLSKKLYQKTLDQGKIALQFQEKLQQIVLNDSPEQQSLITERTTKAIEWFCQSLAEELLQPLQQYIKTLQHTSKIKKYLAELKTIEAFTWQQLIKLQQTKYNNLPLFNQTNPYQHLAPMGETMLPHEKKKKPEKGSSQRISLQLYNEGKTIVDIASIRNLTAGTIEGHLADFVKTGEIDVFKLVNANKVSELLKIIAEMDVLSATPIKEKLGDAYSYGEIRAVINYHQYQLQNQK